MATEVSGLNDKERLLLQALLHKGPALPVELAARTLSFPDEVSASIRDLAAKGLIEVEPLARGRMGGELVFLSEKGKKQLNNLEG
jgi:DNA-binding MarR family transcriptional regulator